MMAIAYIRVSAQSQVGEDKYGLDVQREDIERFACQNSIEIVRWCADEGVSGVALVRDGLSEAIQVIRAKEAKVVIVAKMDRIARDLMAQLYIEKEQLKLDAELISVAEPFRGKDAANVLFRQIIGAFAQFEKARIAERLGGGRKQKAKQGGYAGGRAPIGYRAEHGGKALSIDTDEAEAVRRVFELAEDSTLQAIADRMNNEGFKTKQGGQFYPQTIKRILERRGIYEGVYRYAGIESAGQYEAIIYAGIESAGQYEAII